VEVVNARAESLLGRFDFVVSRAVASLPDFYPWVKGKFSQGILYLKGGDVNEEISTVMAHHKLARGSVSTWPVSSWLQDPYYDGKLVIHIRK
jgi:16S rRNA (guanine527-N7)-methyltransferase